LISRQLIRHNHQISRQGLQQSPPLNELAHVRRDTSFQPSKKGRLRYYNTMAFFGLMIYHFSFTSTLLSLLFRRCLLSHLHHYAAFLAPAYKLAINSPVSASASFPRSLARQAYKRGYGGRKIVEWPPLRLRGTTHPSTG
jgi:hypothetical protein